MNNDEIDALFGEPLLSEVRRPSTLVRLEARRDAEYARRRASGAQLEALLGGIVVAPCRYKPDIHAAMVQDIREWLLLHHSGEACASNVEALPGFLERVRASWSHIRHF